MRDLTLMACEASRNLYDANRFKAKLRKIRDMTKCYAEVRQHESPEDAFIRQIYEIAQEACVQPLE
jgi:hypothetical protein